MAKATLSTMAYNTFLALHFNKVATETNGAVTVSMGRPDLLAEVKSSGASAVFYCGSSGLAKVCEAACEAAGDIPFYEENFQEPELGNLWRGGGPRSG